jgi:8-oxo-dGTP pyrophosphatase MutT (NUDIX family)
MPTLTDLLASYRPREGTEAADVARVLAMVSTVDDPWSRSIPLHVTASALIVHPPSRRVLLRWHARLQSWLHVGGHADAGESDPVTIALREGREETGLPDLRLWPDTALVHVVVVKAPAHGDEPEHEHADLRYVLATGVPELARPEYDHTPIRWLTRADAFATTTEANVRETLSRTYELMTPEE